MGQQIFKAHLDVIESNNVEAIELNYDTVLSNRLADDISYFFPRNLTVEVTNSRPIPTNQIEYIKQIRQQLASLTQPVQWNRINEKFNEIAKNDLLLVLIEQQRTILNEMEESSSNKQRLRTAMEKKFENDQCENVSIFDQSFHADDQNDKSTFEQQQLSFFAIQSLISILLILIKSAEKNDSSLIQQILALAGQLCEQLPIKSLSSSKMNHQFLFKSLKPLIQYIEDLTNNPNTIIAKQAKMILLIFALAKGSFKDLLPLLETLMFNTTDIYPARGLYVQLNKSLTETLKETENDEDLTSLNYLKSIGSYPSPSETNSTGQLLSSIILAHVDLEKDKDSSICFEFHQKTFEKLFQIIEKLQNEPSSSIINQLLTVSLRLFRQHLQHLSMICSQLDKDLSDNDSSSINLDRYVTSDEIHRWFTVLFQLTNENSSERSSIGREASISLISVINLRSTSFMEKLSLLHQYITDNQSSSLLIEQCFLEMKKIDFLSPWIQTLFDEYKRATGRKIFFSLMEIYLQSSDDNQLKEIITQFQQILLCQCLTIFGQKNWITDESHPLSDAEKTQPIITIVIDYLTYLLDKTRLSLLVKKEEFFHDILLGLTLFTDTDQIFHYDPIQSIFVEILPLLAEAFSQFTAQQAFLSWLIGKMSHVLIIGLPVDSQEMKYNQKLKSSIFSGGCESSLVDQNEDLSKLLQSKLSTFNHDENIVESSSDKEDFLLSIYEQRDAGARLISKLKQFSKTKHTLLLKSIEKMAYTACGQIFAVYVKHYRRLNLARHELTRLERSSPHPQLISIYDYSARVITLFSTLKSQGGDCDRFAEQIQRRTSFLLRMIKESSLIPIIKENDEEEKRKQSLPILTVPNPSKFNRQVSRWSKAKHVLTLLRHLFQACLRFKRLMTEKKRSLQQLCDQESLINRMLEQFLYGDVSKLNHHEENQFNLDEFQESLLRQHQRAMIRLLTYRFFKEFIEKLIESNNERTPFLLSLPFIRKDLLDWTYFDHIQASNDHLKRRISETYYSIIKSVFLNEKIHSEQIFYFLNLSLDSIGFSSLSSEQYLEILSKKFITFDQSSQSISLRFIAFQWFRSFAFQLCQQIELEHFQGTTIDPIFKEQEEFLFQTVILNQLKAFEDFRKTSTNNSEDEEEKNSSFKDLSIGWFTRALGKQQTSIENQHDGEIYINQYLVLLLRCFLVYPHAIKCCSTMDYLQVLLNLYHQSQSTTTKILTLKILRYIIASLPDEAKSPIEAFFRTVLLSIGQSPANSADLVPELIYFYRYVMSNKSDWQIMATELVVDAILSYLNLESIERNDPHEINQLLASLHIFGSYIEPYRMGSIVKILSEGETSDDSQLALIIDKIDNSSVSIQYSQTNQCESISIEKLQVETDVLPPTLNDSESMINSILDTLAMFLQTDLSGHSSLLVLQMQRRSMSVLYHLLNNKKWIDIFMMKPYVSLLAQRSISDSVEKTLQQPKDLRLFDKQHLEQYCLSLDRSEGKEKIVDQNTENVSEKSTKSKADPSVIEALSYSKYHGWKSSMSDIEFEHFQKGRHGAEKVTLVSFPRNICDPSVFQECGLKDNFLGRIVPNYENTRSSFPSFIVDQLQFTEGKWYFCVRLSTGGVVQIGWATKGYSPGGSSGVGDDGYSWSYDGSRAVLFNEGSYYGIFDSIYWKENDVCGCGIEIDGDNTNIKYWLNGKFLGTAFRHQEDIAESDTKCNLFPNGPTTSFFPSVTIQRTNNPPRVCEMIINPEDMKDCPLPSGYKPLILPKVVSTEKSIVDYPSRAYLMGDQSNDYFIHQRTKPTITLLRDFINDRHLETTLSEVNNDLLTLSEKDSGFPLSIDIDQLSSITISFDFQQSNHDNLVLCSFDHPDLISILLSVEKSEELHHVVIVIHLNEQRILVYLNEINRSSEHRYTKKAGNELKMNILPNVAGGLKNLALWNYALSEDDIQRLFNYNLFYVASDYQQMKEYHQQMKTISFSADQKEFLDGALIPMSEPFKEELWTQKKKQADSDESKYFKNDTEKNSSTVEIFGNKTYLVLKKSAETWPEYSLILDLCIPQWPMKNEKMNLVEFNSKCSMFVTHEGKLRLVIGDDKHESNSSLPLNEYIRLLISTRERSMCIYVNKKLEIKVTLSGSELHLQPNCIVLFRETDPTKLTVSNETLRLSLKSLSYFNRVFPKTTIDQFAESPDLSLDILINPTFTTIGPSLIAMGYKKSWIESVSKEHHTNHIPTIYSILREKGDRLIENDLEEQQQRYLRILSQLDPTFDEDHLKQVIKSSTHDKDVHIVPLAQKLVHHWIHAPKSQDLIIKQNLPSLPDDGKWFSHSVADLGLNQTVTQWISDKTGSITDNEDHMYQLLDPNHPEQDGKVTNTSTKKIKQSAQYSHENLSQEEFLQSRMACEHGLIIIYARSIILNMLNIWSYNSLTQFPFESLADYSDLIRLIQLLSDTKIDSEEKINPIPTLLSSIIDKEMKQLVERIPNLSEIDGEILQINAPFFYHLQKEILLRTTEFLLKPSSDKAKPNDQSTDRVTSSLFFLLQMLDLLMKFVRKSPKMVSIIFPRPLIHLLFDLFLVIPSNADKFFLLQLLTNLIQTSEQSILSSYQEDFFIRLLIELHSDTEKGKVRSEKRIEVAISDLIFALRIKKKSLTNNETQQQDFESKLNQLPESIQDLFTAVNVIIASLDKTKQASIPAGFLVYGKKSSISSEISLTQEQLDESNKVITRIADQELIQLMNKAISNGDSFSNFLQSLSTGSNTNQPVYQNYASLSTLSADLVRSRAQYLCLLNNLVQKSLPMLDLSLAPEQSLLTDHIRTVKMYLLYSSKFDLFQQSIEKTEGEYFSEWNLVQFDTVQASTDNDNYERTMFYQAYQQLHATAHEVFRRANDQLWRAQYIGMHSTDQGGPYRDSITRIAADICSTRLPLFILCPNGRMNSGANRDCWIPNVFPPHKPIPKKFKKQYRFVGQLLGMAIRKKHYLDLKLAPLVWKGLLREEITVEDIEAIDQQSFKMISELEKNIEQIISIGSAENVDYLFSSILDELHFDVISSAGQTYELVPGGSDIPITMTNFHQYCSQYRQYRLEEFHRQIDCIRQGLYSVVPCYYLSLFTAHELEEAACGKSQIDVDLLKRNTSYGGDYNENTPHIQRFWTVFRDTFTEEQKKSFLTFVWGRSTLPSRDDDFDAKFIIAPFDLYNGEDNLDRALPRSHTCFFTIDLPAYSSNEIMYERLNYAITYCSSIDGDGAINEAQSETIEDDDDSDSDED